MKMAEKRDGEENRFVERGTEERERMGVREDGEERKILIEKEMEIER